MESKKIGYATVKYPLWAFAFGYPKIQIDMFGYTSAILSCGISESRIAYDGLCEFDLWPFIRYNMDVQQMNKTDGALSINKAISRLTIEITLSGGLDPDDGDLMTTVKGSIEFGVIWASKGLDSSYNKHRVLVWNPNYPFTIDLSPVGHVSENGNMFADAFVTCDGNSNAVTTPIMVVDGYTRYGMSNFVPVPPKEYVHIALRGYDYVSESDGLHTVDVRIDNRTDGVYLRWLDRFGRVCYRLFEKTSTITEVATTKEYIRDYAVSVDWNDGYNSGAETYREMGEKTSYQLGIASVDVENMLELMSLTLSQHIDMFKGYDSNNNPMWQRVMIQPGSYTVTKKPLQDFAITILVPTDRIQY